MEIIKKQLEQLKLKSGKLQKEVF